MNILHLFFIFLLAQLSICFNLKSTISSLNFRDFFRPFQNDVIAKTKVQPRELPTESTLTSSIEQNNQIILNKSLKHLEFVSQFEMYLDDKNYENFSLEFLQEFEKIKTESQLSILKSTCQLTYSNKLVA